MTDYQLLKSVLDSKNTLFKIKDINFNNDYVYINSVVDGVKTSFIISKDEFRALFNKLRLKDIHKTLYFTNNKVKRGS